jgi:hypothetical protein
MQISELWVYHFMIPGRQLNSTHRLFSLRHSLRCYFYPKMIIYLLKIDDLLYRLIHDFSYLGRQLPTPRLVVKTLLILTMKYFKRRKAYLLLKSFSYDKYEMLTNTKRIITRRKVHKKTMNIKM